MATTRIFTVDEVPPHPVGTRPSVIFALDQSACDRWPGGAFGISSVILVVHTMMIADMVQTRKQGSGTVPVALNLLLETLDGKIRRLLPRNLGARASDSSQHGGGDRQKARRLVPLQ